jgi:hypothetical protein
MTMQTIANETAPGNALLPLEQQILTISPSLPGPDVLTIYERTRFYKQALADLQDRCEALMIEWIKANGDLQISDTARYYVGTPKTTKCTDLPGAIETILTTVGGDFTKFCEILSSNAIKYGAAKKVLTQEDFERLFKVEERETLEEGKVKKLIKADERFVR